MEDRLGDDGTVLYREYRAEIEEGALARSLKRAILVLFVINSAFIGVDAVVYPDRLVEFLPVRLGLDAVLAGLYYGTASRFPVFSTFATCASGGWMLITVVLGTGGAASDYYVGLVLLIIGLGVLVPATASQAVVATSILFCSYVVAAVAKDGVGALHESALALFFLAAAAFMSVMSCAYLDRMRFTDFRQRREIERARDELAELDVAKSRFTANIHHELRTPLTLTLAPVEAMLAGDFGEVSEVQRGYLETIHSNGLRLLKLINNLLDLAKIEGAQLQVTRRPLVVGDVVERIVHGARPLAERKGVALETRGLEALPQIHADPEALEKLVVNLLGNALKFTDEGGRIEVSGAPGEAGGVDLVVADTGLGIPPDQLDRIFDRFAQVDGSSTRKHEGTGIGLSLVKELVALHGGRIWAESEGLGHGTRMCVHLPPGEADEQAAEALLEGEQGPVDPARSLAALGAELELDPAGDESVHGDALRLAELQRNVERTEGARAPADPAVSAPHVPADAPEVLVVEDNVDMRRLLAHLVGQEFRLRVARNGREGLERVRERQPDLVLTDVMMPEMSGTELCAALKGDPETAGIPVVLVTSKAEREMKIEGLELGADDYVTKPFHPRELMARVRSLTKLRRLQAELAVRNALLESTNEELQSTMQDLKEASSQLVHAERLAAVGEIAAGVAHEVNNPVNFALNAARTLRTLVDDVRALAEGVAGLDPAQQPAALAEQVRALEALRERVRLDETAESLVELSDIVSQGLERTSGLVSNLRDFAAPGDGSKAVVDVARGVASTLQLVRHTLSAEDIDLRVKIPSGLPTLVGDPRALNQVFLNLLKNAAEAFEGGGGTISVRVRQEAGDIVVEIRDDGPGIDPSVQDDLFSPFVTTKEAGRGTGLGLSISRRIVEEHGGTIELDTAPGRGTTARVRLPTQPGEGGGTVAGEA